VNGPDGAAGQLTAVLKDLVPARLARIRVAQGVDPEDLPDPMLFVDHDHGPLALEEWPAILVLPQNMVGMTRVDVIEGGREVYQVTYAVRILCWVRHHTWAGTDLMRRRYVTAVREALLDRRNLTASTGAFGASDAGLLNGQVAVAPSTIRESYSDVFTDANGQTIAAASTDVNIMAIELTDATSLGTADTVDVVVSADTDGVQPHPGL
jgi:hypothetical protein